jgi:hypothetical protein
VTSPNNVGEVSVEILAEARDLAKSIRKQVEEGFKGLDIGKLIRDSIGNEPIKVPLKPDFDEKDLPKSLPGKAPKVPVELDPLMAAFQAEIKRQTAALAREVNIRIPVDGDTSGLREELGAQLKAVSDQLRVKVPAEPGDKAKFQSELQAQLAEVSARVKAHVGVDADTRELPEKVRQTRVPNVKVQVDPVLAAFQAEVRAQAGALARTVNANVPVGADTNGLRAELGAQLAEIQAQTKIQVPTEPGAKAAYESKLKAELAEVAARVKQTVHVEAKVDVDKSGVGDLLPNLSGMLANVTSLGSGIQGIVGPAASLSGFFGYAATALAALAAGAALAVPAITAVAGAAAAIPAALVGAGAIFGTFSLGLKGISDAFKPKAGGGGGAGGSAVNQAKQIAAASRSVEAARRGIAAANRSLDASERGLAAAERGVVQAQQALVNAEKDVADAQKRAAAAQLAVSKARVDAAEDIDDLNRALRGAKLSEEDAALSVTEALRALNEAKLTGNIPDIQRADLAYREALQTLDEAKDTTDDLQKSTDEANKKGVDGSDKVTGALQDQQDALDGVTKAQQGVVSAQNGILDAADSLKSAQDGVLSAQDGIKSAADGLASAQDSLAQAQQKVASGGGAAAAAVTKLAPAAQRFVDAVKGLKPAFEDLRLDVQQRLFEGLDKTVTNLGQAWIPALKTTLGSYADTFNQFFKNLGASITTPTFIADIQAGAEGARQGIKKIGDSVTTSLVPAFGALSRAAGPFLSQLGGEIADVVTQFSNWVLQGEKTGGLKSFFDKAAAAMHEIFTTGKLVGSIIGSLFEIITGASGNGSKKTALDSFNDGLKKVADFLDNPKNQQAISGFFTTVASAVVGTAKAIGDLVSKIRGWVDKFTTLKESLFPTGAGDSANFGNQLGHTLTEGLATAAKLLLLNLPAIGRDLIGGLIAGIVAATVNIGGFLAAIFWDGPSSILGLIKVGFGIASPSTKMIEVGRNLVLGLIAGVESLFGSLAGRARSLASTVIGAVGSGATWLVAAGKNAVIGLINGVGSLLGNLRAYAGNLRVTIVNATSSAGSWLTSAGRNAIIGLGNGIISMFGTLRTWAGNAKVYIQNGLSNAGSLLVAAGKNVIIGLINGIGSMLGTLGNYLGDVGAFIVAHKGPPSADKVMLYGAGRLIMGGLISGISDQKDALAAELSNVSSLVSGTSLGGLGAGFDGAVSASLSAASQQQVLVSWKTGTTGDQFLDSLANLIDLRHNGNVQAALSRT